MIILLIILVIASAGSCSSCGDPPSTIVPVGPPPSTCTSVVLCVASCDDVATSTCAPCPSGTFDTSFCVDGGFPPMDGGTCDDIPCAVASECGYECGEEPFYVGCCDCPAGTIDMRTECAFDAGPPDASDASLDADAADASDGGDGAPDGGGLLEVGRPCFDDRQCASGLCYGEADASGAFSPPTCQAMCLGFDDRGYWCRNDRHCCGGTCCVGCGELEGLCRADP